MKKIIWLIAAVVVMNSCQTENANSGGDDVYANYYDDYNSNASAPDGGLNYQTFYDELSPYGNWANTPDYGYVWVPANNQAQGFSPYLTNGHWDTPTMAGPGYRIMHGAGGRFIMAIGIMMVATAGHGYRAITGRLHGWHGAITMITTVGHLLGQGPLSHLITDRR